jgi:hypothetical protein
MFGLCRYVGEKDQRRRQAAFMLVEVMLGNPRAVKAETFGVANLFGCQPVALLRRGRVQQAGEKPRRLRVMRSPCSEWTGGE